MVAPFLPIRCPLRQKPVVGAQINPNHDLSQGLVGAWLLNEGGGKNLFDSSGNSNTLAAVSGTMNWTSAPFGRGLFCTNLTLIKSPMRSIPLATPMTFTAWIGSSNLSSINTISGSYSGSSALGWGFEISTAGKLLVKWNSTTILTGSITLSAGTIYHVAFTRSGTSGSWVATTYINGVQDATTSTSTNPNGTQTTITLCSNSASGNHLIGLIDNALCYNRPLSAAEIQQLYTDPFCFIQQPKIGIMKRKHAAATSNTYGFAGAGGVQGTGIIGIAS